MTNYFDGIQFVTEGETPSTSMRTAKSFDGYYGIQYNHAGNVLLSIDHEPPLTLSGPHVFLTSPGHFFEYGAPQGEKRYHVFCCFRGPRVNAFLESGLIPADPLSGVTRITRPEQFISTLRTLLTLLRRPGGAELPRAVLLLEDLLLQLHEQPPAPDAERPFFHALDELSEAVRQKPNLDWDFTKEARSIGISEPYLRKLFTEYFTCSPHRFLLECRIRLASELLLRRPIPVSEVAAAAGFDDPYYFSRVFKKHKGISPLRYRSVFAL